MTPDANNNTATAFAPQSTQSRPPHLFMPPFTEQTPLTRGNGGSSQTHARQTAETAQTVKPCCCVVQ